MHKRYRADITTGSLKVAESRVIADLLLSDVGEEAWHRAIHVDNRLQTRSTTTGAKISALLRRRLMTMEPDIWRMVRDGSGLIPVHACLAAAVKSSALLGDFMDLVLRDEYCRRSAVLPTHAWSNYLDECRNRDPHMKEYSDATRNRLRSTVFQILAQAGYLSDSRSLLLQRLVIERPVLEYLETKSESYVLRCLTVAS